MSPSFLPLRRVPSLFTSRRGTFLSPLPCSLVFCCLALCVPLTPNGCRVIVCRVLATSCSGKGGRAKAAVFSLPSQSTDAWIHLDLSKAQVSIAASSSCVQGFKMLLLFPERVENLKHEPCSLSPELAPSSKNNNQRSLTESHSAALCFQGCFWHLRDGAEVTVWTVVHYLWRLWRDTGKLLENFRSRIAHGRGQRAVGRGVPQLG